MTAPGPDAPAPGRSQPPRPATAPLPVILDGVIAGAAALAAAALAPGAPDLCIAGHRSAEPGHAIAIEALGLRLARDSRFRPCGG
ncbi:MAG: nicotinate-nucleotide--dimethylbenzimidazole phosphoribosyltransferase [Streptosporangiaceae bacterium]